MLHQSQLPELKRTPRPERRMGYFYVSRLIVEEHWDKLLVVMPHIVPLQVQYRPDMDAYEYLAHSELFEVIERGYCAPIYDCIFTRVPSTADEPSAYTFEFKRSPFERRRY